MIDDGRGQQQQQQQDIDTVIVIAENKDTERQTAHTKKNINKNNKNKRKRCSHCGKLGHVEANCWNRPENSNKRPKWYKPPRVDGNEQSNAAIDDGDIDPVGELLCMAVEKKMSFPSVDW